MVMKESNAPISIPTSVPARVTPFNTGRQPLDRGEATVMVEKLDHGNGEIELNANYILFIRNVFPAGVNMPYLNFADKADYLQCSPTARYNVNEGFDPRLMRHCIVNDMGAGENKWEQFLAVAKSEYNEKLNDKQSMENSGINPDSYSYNQLLKGLCKAKQIEKAYKLFANMMEMEGLCDMVSCNLLIDGLCRASKTSIAHKLFKGMSLKGIQPDTVTYDTLINGFLIAGNAEIAEELFDQMFKVGVIPNANAYCIRVHHYCKTGRIGLACSYFDDIIIGGISPDVVSYSALVNGLLRAHRVIEVMDVPKTKWENMLASLSCGIREWDWLCDENSYSPTNWQTEMLDQFKDSKVQPHPLDWGKPLHVVILKSAFKVFDPGICCHPTSLLINEPRTESSSFYSWGE
ncbi:Pentatricopeptide repeat-containing protein [Dendrobium catenatum]|uniref:Pentatricopeptide repeat-containing protein n=1 Tax=Dendrobium catenatum TaxID=906689 RepID=A0A2I0WJE5_9ASPA|nr:Pentatricopeptide repeat-containing protein [Dendrobium catenatum]